MPRYDLRSNEKLLPPSPSFRQCYLIEKINQYLGLFKRDLLDADGHCHGLTLLWMQKMAERREQWFYDMVQRIVTATDEQLYLFDDDVDVQKFIAKIEFAQYPLKYTEKLAEPEVTSYYNVNKILELSGQIVKDGHYTQKTLRVLCRKIAQYGNAAVLWGGSDRVDPNDHTIGIFYRNRIFYLYNANNQSGKAEAFGRAGDLVSRIVWHLYTDFGKATPDRFLLSISLLDIKRAANQLVERGFLRKASCKRRKLDSDPNEDDVAESESDESDEKAQSIVSVFWSKFSEAGWMSMFAPQKNLEVDHDAAHDVQSRFTAITRD